MDCCTFTIQTCNPLEDSDDDAKCVLEFRISETELNKPVVYNIFIRTSFRIKIIAIFYESCGLRVCTYINILVLDL